MNKFEELTQKIYDLKDAARRAANAGISAEYNKKSLELKILRDSLPIGAVLTDLNSQQLGNASSGCNLL
jgi:hypothetical protein